MWVSSRRHTASQPAKRASEEQLSSPLLRSFPAERAARQRRRRLNAPQVYIQFTPGRVAAFSEAPGAMSQV